MRPSICDRIASKVMTDADWLDLHEPHGQKRFEDFPHPSGDWFWLVCPCGAKQLTTKKPTEES
jgi:hypothetical protein